MPVDLILGTAGHIDHGKSALVKALTGVDTDRLPEEKRRGITIDLGFACLRLGDFHLGVVDVPGHERFVRNMLAGATGLDLALLVVAADDSVKPQTVEHLDILRLLDLPAGVIALTKVDTVAADWLALVAEEVRSLVEGTFLASAPLIPTSTVTGQGLEELRAALTTAAARAAEVRQNRVAAPLRMPIDRVFHVPGHGVVATGSVQSGRMAIGDELELQPGNHRVRVRGLQNHDEPAEHVQRGQRAAVNLAGIKAEQLHRGHELAAVGHLRPARVMTARVHLNSGARALPNRTCCRIHLGAAEILARLRLLNTTRLEPGEPALVQLRLEEEAVAVWGQPFIVRSESPVVTIGGGIVIDPDAPLLRRPSTAELELLNQWLAPEPQRRASAALYFAGLRPWKIDDLYRSAGVENAEHIVEQLRTAKELVTLPLSSSRTMEVHRLVMARLEARLEDILARMHDEHPLRLAFPQSSLVHKFSAYGEPAVLGCVIDGLVRAGTVRQLGSSIGLARRGPQLSQNEQKLLHQLIDWYREAGLEAPTVAELQARAAKNQAAVPQLVALAAENGDLVRVNEQYYLHADVDRAMRQRLAAEWPSAGAATVSQLRELLNTTRKYAVPYCEYLDRIGFTARTGDLRQLTRHALPSAPFDDSTGSC